MPISIEDALEHWQHWSFTKRPKVVKQFKQGLNHSCYLIQAGMQLAVVKMFAQHGDNGMTAQAWAAEHDLAPALIYLDSAADYCVMQYVEPAVDSKITPSLLAAGLQRLHAQSPPESTSFDLQAYCDQYYNKLSGAEPALARLRTKLRPILERFDADGTPLVFCHNDLVQANCLRHAQGLQFIDWEFAQLNNPWFDIASVVFYFKLDKAAQLELISHYWKDRGLHKLPIVLNAGLCAVIWLDILWTAGQTPSTPLSAQSDKLVQLRLSIEEFKAAF